MIIKVLTTNFKEKKLNLTKKELKELKLELSGEKPYIQEYRIVNNGIITDLEIISII